MKINRKSFLIQVIFCYTVLNPVCLLHLQYVPKSRNEAKALQKAVDQYSFFPPVLCPCPFYSFMSVLFYVESQKVGKDLQVSSATISPPPPCILNHVPIVTSPHFLMTSRDGDATTSLGSCFDVFILYQFLYLSQFITQMLILQS